MGLIECSELEVPPPPRCCLILCLSLGSAGRTSTIAVTRTEKAFFFFEQHIRAQFEDGRDFGQTGSRLHREPGNPREKLNEPHPALSNSGKLWSLALSLSLSLNVTTWSSSAPVLNWRRAPDLVLNPKGIRCGWVYYPRNYLLKLHVVVKSVLIYILMSVAMGILVLSPINVQGEVSLIIHCCAFFFFFFKDPGLKMFSFFPVSRLAFVSKQGVDLFLLVLKRIVLLNFANYS